MRKIASLLLLTLAAPAREFWLEAPRLRLNPGDAVALCPSSGDNFTSRPWPGGPAKIRRLVRYGPAPADSAALRPADTLRVAFARPGLHLLALQTTDTYTELPGPAFEAYLQAQGLSRPLAQRAAAGQQAAPGREAYRRCATTLLQVGDPAAQPRTLDTTALRPHGLPLALVPEQNPYRLAPGRSLTVRLLRAGVPVAGGLVQVWQRQPAGLPTTRFATRTNAAGRILFKLPGPGPYLLAAVAMEPAPPALRARADWQSVWASLTFGGPPAGTGAKR